MIFRQLLDPDSCTLTYLIADPSSHEAVIIDPVKSQVPLLLAILSEQQSKLKYVLRTHVHRPRRTDSAGLSEATGARYLIGAANPADIVAERLKEGDSLQFGGQQIQVIETPGHTPGCVSYLWLDRVFCGDVMEIGGCGQAEDETDPGVMFDSVIDKLFPLADETLVFPCHDYSGRTVSTVAEERKRNSAFSGVSRDLFIARMKLIPKRPAAPDAKWPTETEDQ
jgi:sulfur dioxygenase